MANIQDTKVQYFMHMCIVQPSSIFTTTHIDHNVFMALFLSKMNYSGLITPEPFWTSMFHFSSVLLLSFPKKFSQGPTRSCWRDACGTYLWHLQCLWNCCLWLTVFTLLRSDEDIKYGFQISRKHWRSVFVFSLLVKLIWFGEMAELSKSVLSNFKRMRWYQPLMYGSKPHILEYIFYRSRPTKIKSLYIGPSHAGALYSY